MTDSKVKAVSRVGVLASCARPDGAYAAIGRCGNDEHDPRCAYHGIVMEQFAKGLRSSLSLDANWDGLGDGWYGSSEDAAILAQLLREAKEGVPHQCDGVFQ